MDELSTLSPAAADTTARTARTSAAALTEATTHLTATRIAGWEGTAQLAHLERLADLHTRTDLLAAIATAGATIIEDHSRELGMLQGRLRTTDAELAHAQTRTQDPSLTAVIDHVPKRPRTRTEHLDDAATALGENLTSSLWISLGWLDDPHGWWNDVRQIPTSLLEEVTHPEDTARDVLDLDDLQDGRYGHAAGTLAGAAIGKGLGKAVERATPDLRTGHDRDGHGGAPRLPLQSLDEMLAGVDLTRSEGIGGAHTIERHVDVDDQYLKDRLLLGTLNEESGKRDFKPPRASRWADLPTAEAVISRAVRDNESALRALPSPGELKLEVPVNSEAGKMYVTKGNVVVEATVKTGVIIVKRDAGGRYRIHTSYLER